MSNKGSLVNLRIFKSYLFFQIQHYEISNHFMEKKIAKNKNSWKVNNILLNNETI